MPSRKHKMLQGGSLASDAVMASVAKGSLVPHTNEVQAGGAAKRSTRAKGSRLTTPKKAKAKPAYRQCGGSIASDAVQSLVPESAMHLHTNLFCPPEHPSQVGAGWTKPKATKRGSKRLPQKGGNIQYGLSLPAPATGDMARSLAVPASGFMDISSSVLSKMAAYPDCLSQSKFIFGGVQDGSGNPKKRRSAKRTSGKKDCQCGAGMKTKKSLPKPKKKSARSKSAPAKKPTSR